MISEDFTCNKIISQICPFTFLKYRQFRLRLHRDWLKRFKAFWVPRRFSKNNQDTQTHVCLLLSQLTKDFLNRVLMACFQLGLSILYKYVAFYRVSLYHPTIITTSISTNWSETKFEFLHIQRKTVWLSEWLVGKQL